MRSGRFLLIVEPEQLIKNFITDSENLNKFPCHKSARNFKSTPKISPSPFGNAI